MQYKWFNVYHLKKMHKQSQINEKKKKAVIEYSDHAGVW